MSTSNGPIRHLSRLDIPGGGQVTISDGFAYVGHMAPPFGTSIVDIRDPAKPQLIHTLMLEDASAHTHKVRVIGDLMYVNVEQSDRHDVRRAQNVIVTDGNLTDAEIAARAKTSERVVAQARVYLDKPYTGGGCKIYDIADKTAPKLVSYIRTFGFGAHRFDVDENYLYLSTEMEGYIGNILVIYAISNPSKPVEVGRWWMKGQHIAAGEKPEWEGYGHRLHHAMRVGDELWAACMQAGVHVIDASDVTRPVTLGSYDYHPPFRCPTHTVIPLRARHNGRRVAVAVDEEHEIEFGQLHAGLWFLDVEDLNDIRPISMFHLPESASPYTSEGERFGAHQFAEVMHDDTLFVAWFSGGLRLIDTAKPASPHEIGSYLPEAPKGFRSPQSNDVSMDSRGIVCLMDRNAGLDVLEYGGKP